MSEYLTLDTWGQPIYGNGQAPLGPAQLTEVASMAMARGVRRFATQADLLAITGHAVGYLAAVDAIPGALWIATGTGAGAWSMFGTPRFADSSARSGAITTPVQGMKTYNIATAREEVYWLAYNASTNPLSPYSATGWYNGLPIAARARKNAALTLTTNVVTDVSATTYWDAVATVGFAAPATSIIIPAPGRYVIEAGAEFASTAAGSREVFVNRNSTTYSTNGLAHGVLGTGSGASLSVSVERSVVLAAGDELRMFIYQNSGGNLAWAVTADLSWWIVRRVGDV